MNLRDQLLSIRATAGKLTPAVVVEAASPVDHPLHDRFEWDDALAGHAHRIQQARQLLASVVRVTTTTGKGEASIREFHAVRRGDISDEHDYMPVDELLADPVATQIVLRTMEREWKSLKARYGHLAEFAAMVAMDIAA